MDFPVEHLSASSINLFLRCPRQWQKHYIIGDDDEEVGEPLVIGAAVHLGLSRVLVGEDPGDYWGDAIAGEARTIVFKSKPEDAKALAEKMVYHYYEQIGKWLPVVATEQEVQIEVPGVPIPVLGYVDILTSDRIIDVKTTGYLNRNVKLNPEWRLQAHIYQLAHPMPAEFHVLTRAKSDPLVVPGSKDDKLYIRPPSPEKTMQTVQYVYNGIEDCLNRYGLEQPWPGNPNHEWASKYCSVENCCGRF